MAKNKHISPADVVKIAKLAALPIPANKRKIFASQMETVYQYVEILKTIDTSTVPETNQVTGLSNILREDRVDSRRMLTQAQALRNARHSHRGYFLVPAILT